MSLTAQYVASQQPQRPLTMWDRIINWLDIWGPRAGMLALAITIGVLVWLVPTLDAMGQAALRSCGL